MAKEIDLKEVISIIQKRLWMVVAITIFFVAIGIAYNHFSTTPLYQSSSRIIINADAEYRKTLQVIMKDPAVMEKVVEELKLERSPESLARQLTVQSIDTSQVVSIGVIDTNPTMATEIANTTAKVFKEEIPNIIGFEGCTVIIRGKCKSLSDK